jgi:hypothetical protein
MSILFNFTDHGTIRIQCGDEVVEVPLPGNGGGQTAAPPTPQMPPPQRPTISTIPRTTVPPYGAPKRPPSIAGVVTVGIGRQREHPADALWVRNHGAECMTLSIAELTDLAGRSQVRQNLLAQRSRLAGSHAGLVLLDVDIPPQHLTRTIDLSAMRSLVQDPSLGIDGVRLVPVLSDDIS